MLIRLVALLAVSMPCVAQDAGTSSFRNALQEARLPLSLREGKLGGSGGDLLTREINAARFVLVGETHFTQEIPQFVSAVCRVMHPDAYAVEAGPLMTGFVAGQLHDPERATHISAELDREPESIAFLNMREENDLAANCAETSPSHFELWGLDQEYVGAAGPLLEAMLATKPGPLSVQAIHTAQEREQAAEQVASAKNDVKQLYLINASDADLRQLRQAIQADGLPETVRLFKELEASHNIYQMRLAGQAESNHARAVLLKQHLLANYVPFHSRTPAGRVLFKFGAMHMGRGFDPLHQLNLGNTVGEMADVEGVQSLHISILGAGGIAASSGAYRKPLETNSFNLLSGDKQAAWLAPALAELIPKTSNGGMAPATMFNLRKLRFRGLTLAPEWEQLIYSYDVLIILPRVSPAVPLQH